MAWCNYEKASEMTWDDGAGPSLPIIKWPPSHFSFRSSMVGAKHDVFESTKDARPGLTPAAATRSQWQTHSHHIARPPSRPAGALFLPSWSPRRLPRAARCRPRRVVRCSRRGHLRGPSRRCDHRRDAWYTRKSTQNSSCRCCCARRWSRNLRDWRVAPIWSLWRLRGHGQPDEGHQPLPLPAATARGSCVAGRGSCYVARVGLDRMWGNVASTLAPWGMFAFQVCFPYHFYAVLTLSLTKKNSLVLKLPLRILLPFPPLLLPRFFFFISIIIIIITS